MEITKTQNFDTTKIFFGDCLHLAFKHQRLIAVQSWRDYNKLWSIEMTFENGTIVESEYDSESKWKSVLAIISEILGKDL